MRNKIRYNSNFVSKLAKYVITFFVFVVSVGLNFNIVYAETIQKTVKSVTKDTKLYYKDSGGSTFGNEYTLDFIMTPSNGKITNYNFNRGNEYRNSWTENADKSEVKEAFNMNTLANPDGESGIMAYAGNGTYGHGTWNGRIERSIPYTTSKYNKINFKCIYNDEEGDGGVEAYIVFYDDTYSAASASFYRLYSGHSGSSWSDSVTYSLNSSTFSKIKSKFRIILWISTVGEDDYGNQSDIASVIYAASGDLHTHKYDKKVVADKYLKSAATCTSKAVYYKSCECGERGSDTFESGSALGHKWQTATASNNNGLRSAATCTAAATYYRKCSRCSAKDENQYDSVGSPLNHDYSVDSGVQYKAATCTAPRYNYKKCSRCGDNPKSASYIVAVGSKLNHDFTSSGATHTYAKPVITWSSSGYTATYTQSVTDKCSRCTTTQTRSNIASGNCSITNAIASSAWPSYDGGGTRVYTASTGSVNGQSNTSTKNQSLSQLSATKTISALNAKKGVTSKSKFTVSPSMTGGNCSTTYQWQMSKDGTNFTNLSNGNGWSNVTTAEVSYLPPTYDANIKTIRCVATTTLTDTISGSTSNPKTVTKSVISNAANIWNNPDSESSFTYSVSYLPGTGTGSISKQSFIYPNTVKIKDSTGFSKPGYDFVQWKDASGKIYNPDDVYGTDVNITLTAQWSPRNDTPYKVYHFKQKLDGTYDESNPDDIDPYTGTTDTNATPDVKAYTGFTSPSKKSQNINGTGDTIVKYYYTRNSYDLTVVNGFKVDAVNGKSVHETIDKIVWNGSWTESYKFEEPVKLIATPTIGYSVSAWSGSELISDPSKSTIMLNMDGGSSEATFNMPADDVNLKVVSVTNKDTKYTVYHYQQNLDGNTYPLSPTDTDNLTGETDTEASLARKSYVGFTCTEATDYKMNIDGDGGASHSYYYTRNRYKYTVEVYEQHIDDDDYDKIEEFQYEHYYDELVNPVVVAREGFTSPDMTSEKFNMPANNNTVIKEYFKRNSYKYKVNHYIQKLEATSDEHTEANYELCETDPDPGVAKFNKRITPDTKGYTGFTDPIKQSFNVPAHDNTVIDYYYKRNTYKYHIEIYEQHIDDDEYDKVDTKEFEALFEQNIDPEVIDREGFTSPIVDSFQMPANDDVVVKEYFKRNSYEYHVNHHIQKVGANASVHDAENYEPRETDPNPGIARFDKEITPPVKDYTGFTAPETQSFNVPAHDNTVIDYYYKRNSYKVNLKVEIENAAELDSSAIGCTVTGDGTYEFEAGISLGVTLKDGYEWVGWKSEDLVEDDYINDKNLSDEDFEFKMPAKNVTVIAVVRAKIVTYTVNHWCQKLDADELATLDSNDKTNNYELKDTQVFEALADSRVTPDFITYFGFIDPKEKQTVVVKGDGTTVVDYYYLRNTKVPYKVEHYLMNMALDGYFLKDTETPTGIYGTWVTPDTKHYDGFITPSVQRVTVKYDGSTLVQYYYTRRNDCRYRVNYYLQKPDSTEYVLNKSDVKEAVFEESVTPEVFDYDGYISPEPITKSITYDGSDVFDYYYNRERYTYTINHYLQNLDNEGYTFTESTKGEGEYEEIIRPEPNIYPGFTIKIQPSVIAGKDKVVNFYYKRDNCNVDVIDIGRYPGTQEEPFVLGIKSYQYPFGEEVSADISGTDTADNVYYKGFRYISSTKGIVSADGLVVYRYFDYVFTSYEEEIDLGDSVDGAHLEACTVEFIRSDGFIEEVLDKVTYTVNDRVVFRREMIPKYDKDGNEYTYSTEKTYKYGYSLNNLFGNVTNCGGVEANVEEGSIRITNPLAGSVFSLQKAEIVDNIPVMSNAKVMETTKHGAVSYDYLDDGVYNLKEISAPGGYISCDYETWLNIVPDYNSDGTLDAYSIYKSDSIVKAMDIENCKKIYGSNFRSSSDAFEPQAITNLICGTVTVKFEDADTGRALEGEKIVLYSSDGEVVSMVVTDSTGLAVIDRLDYDNYTVTNPVSAVGYPKVKETINAPIVEEEPDLRIVIKKSKNGGYSVVSDDDGRIPNTTVLYVGKSYKNDNFGKISTDKGASNNTLNAVMASENLNDNNGKKTDEKIFKTVATVNGNKVIVIKGDGAEYTIRDEVKFANYGEQGAEYTMVGYLVDKASGKPISGVTNKYISSKQSFTNDGLVELDMEFEVPSGILTEGQTIVVFETVVDKNGKVIKEHADLDDKDQMISVKGYVPIQTGVYPSNQLSFCRFWKEFLYVCQRFW